MLRNEIYTGRIIYNRTRWTKGRDGKRKKQERPRDEWIVEEAPELRIIDEDLWEAAQDTIARRGGAGGGHRRIHSRRHFLADVRRCGECGLAFSAANGRDRFGCTGRRMRGTCDVALHIDHQEMADRILAALEGLLSEERVARIVAKAEALIQAALDQGDMKLDRERLRAVDRKLRRKAVLFEEEDDEVAAARIHREMRPLRAERKALRERLAAAESCGLDCDAIRAELEKLALDVRTNATESAEAAREALLALIAEDEYGKRRLDVIEDPEAPGGYRIEGTLRMPIALETGNADRKATSGRRLTRLVAWAGFGTKSAPAFPRLTLPVEGVVGVATA